MLFQVLNPHFIHYYFQFRDFLVIIYYNYACFVLLFDATYLI